MLFRRPAASRIGDSESCPFACSARTFRNGKKTQTDAAGWEERLTFGESAENGRTDGEACVYGESRVFGDACVDGKTKIGGATEVRGSYDYDVCGNTRIGV